MTKPTRIGFEISFSARGDGTVEAMYVHLSSAPVAETREIEEDILIADYDEDNDLVGLEILAPVSISSLVEMVDPLQQEALRNFLSKMAPQELVYN